MDIREKREKSRQLKKFYRTVIAWIIIACFAVLLFILVGNQFYNAGLSKVKSEIAYSVKRENSIEIDGYAFRNETVIDTNVNGICTYNIDDGERVSKGSVVANVYSTADQASKVEKIDELSETVDALKELQTASVSMGADPDLLNKQIEETMFDLLTALNSGDISSIDSTKSSLVYSMSKYNIITNNETDYNEKISALEKEIKDLKAGLSSDSLAIKAPGAGYYISSVDGYENVLKSSDVFDMTIEQFESAVVQQSAASSSAGKIVGDYDWYLVSVVEGEDVDKLNQYLGSSVSVILPYTSEGKFTASVVRVGENRDGSKAIAVLKCSNMSRTLASFRHQKVKIVFGSYVGLSVNPKAIRTSMEEYVKTENGEEIVEQKQFRYVYIRTGGVARKRYVEVLYEDLETETAVCRAVSNDYEVEMRKPDEYRRNYLDYYDEVIVEGVEMSDGKIVR